MRQCRWTASLRLAAHRRGKAIGQIDSSSSINAESRQPDYRANGLLLTAVCLLPTACCLLPLVASFSSNL